MAIISILAILILASIYIITSKNTHRLPVIALAIGAILAVIFFIASLGSNTTDAFYYGMIVFFLGVGLLIVWASYT